MEIFLGHGDSGHFGWFTMARDGRVRSMLLSPTCGILCKETMKEIKIAILVFRIFFRV